MSAQSCTYGAWLKVHVKCTGIFSFATNVDDSCVLKRALIPSHNITIDPRYSLDLTIKFLHEGGEKTHTQGGRENPHTRGKTHTPGRKPTHRGETHTVGQKGSGSGIPFLCAPPEQNNRNMLSIPQAIPFVGSLERGVVADSLDRWAEVTRSASSQRSWLSVWGFRV